MAHFYNWKRGVTGEEIEGNFDLAVGELILSFYFSGNSKQAHKVARALLLRGDERAMIFRDRLFDLIDGVDKATSWEAAQAVGRIAESQCEVLSKGNHAVIRVSSSRLYFYKGGLMVSLAAVRTEIFQSYTTAYHLTPGRRCR